MLKTTLKPVRQKAQLSFQKKCHIECILILYAIPRHTILYQKVQKLLLMKQHFNTVIKTNSRWTLTLSRTPTSPQWLFNIQHISKWSLSIPLKVITVLMCDGWCYYYIILKKKVMSVSSLNKEQTVHRTMLVQHIAGQNIRIYYSCIKDNRCLFFWVLHLVASLQIRTWREKTLLCSTLILIITLVMTNQSSAFCNKVFLQPQLFLAS